jgi:lactose/L-arabinose transport system permease protein
MSEQALNPTPVLSSPLETGRLQQLIRTIVKHRWAYLFISPFFILFAIFGVYPTLFSLYLSLNEWNGVGQMEFVGLDNFGRMLNDRLFLKSFENSIILFLTYVPIMLFLALLLAVILNSPRVRGFRIFRTLIFLPFITNMIAAGFAFQILLNKQYGLINSFLSQFGIDPVPWLETPFGARISLSLLIIWAWLGYNMVMMLAGLQTISSDVKEAAKVDGANTVQVFWYIIVPLMRPVILFCAIMSTMGTFGLFAEVDTLTGGGPQYATITPLIKIYGNAFTQFQLGYASAMGYTYFIAIFILTIFQVRTFGRTDDEQGRA